MEIQDDRKNQIFLDHHPGPNWCLDHLSYQEGDVVFSASSGCIPNVYLRTTFLDGFDRFFQNTNQIS